MSPSGGVIWLQRKQRVNSTLWTARPCWAFVIQRRYFISCPSAFLYREQSTLHMPSWLTRHLCARQGGSLIIPFIISYYCLLPFFSPQGFWICKIDEELWCDLDYTNTCVDASAVLSLGEKWRQECVWSNLVIILLEVFIFSPFLSLFLDFFFHATSSIRTRFSF